MRLGLTFKHLVRSLIAVPEFARTLNSDRTCHPNFSDCLSNII
ncbi:hypothetical protein [Microcoleus sp. herbarium12]